MRLRTVVVAPEQLSLRRLDSKWKAQLAGWVDWIRLGNIEGCGSVYRLWTCSKHLSHTRVTRIGCKDSLCYVCSFTKKQEQVADKMELLDTLYSELHETVSCQMFTFTIPSDLWDRIGDDPDAVSRLERMAVEVLSDYFGGEGVSVEGQKRVRRYVLGGDVVAQFSHSFHPAKECRGKDCLRCKGKGCRGNVWRGVDYHVHALVYSMMYDRLYEVYSLDGLTKGAFVRRTLALSSGEVQKMRLGLASMWKSKLESRYGKSSFRPEGRTGPKGYASSWDVGYRYYPRRHDVGFVLGYCLRSEVQDAYREVVYNGCSPRTEEERAWLQRMLTLRKKGSHRYSGFGWMSNAVLNKYSRRIGVQFKRKAVRLKERRKLLCDICGGEMVSSWMDKKLTLEEVVSSGLLAFVSTRRREGG